MKIELLRLGETIGTARVQKNWAWPVFRIIADIFNKHIRVFSDFLLKGDVVSMVSLFNGSEGKKKAVSMPFRLHPPVSFHDHGNCTYGSTPRPAILGVPVGNPAANNSG